MEKYIAVIHMFVLFFSMQTLICDSSDYSKTEPIVSQAANDNNDELDKDDEKLFQEILNILSSTYKNMIDIAALYFCGFSVDQNKLYEQIIIHVSKDIFNVIKLFAWYIPVMLKNPKLKTKEKLKKSCYVVSATVAFWYICTEILPNKSKNNCLGMTRSLDLKFDDIPTSNEEILKPRNRPKIDS
jgi:hypothetical protein